MCDIKAMGQGETRTYLTTMEATANYQQQTRRSMKLVLSEADACTKSTYRRWMPKSATTAMTAQEETRTLALPQEDSSPVTYLGDMETFSRL